jgi:hypothetical protein
MKIMPQNVGLFKALKTVQVATSLRSLTSISVVRTSSIDYGTKIVGHIKTFFWIKDMK